MSHPSYEIIKELQFALRYTGRIKKAPGQELKQQGQKAVRYHNTAEGGCWVERWGAAVADGSV